jgi:hypothetical protein
MTEQDALSQATDQDFLAELAHPDPDPERLPEIHAGSELALQAETATRLLRATLRQEASVERLKEAMAHDMAAWQAMIAKAELSAKTWREIVKAWMQRTGTTQLKHPMFTASLAKGRSRIVVDDEARVLSQLKAMRGGEKAIKVKESIIKSEFDAIFNAIPSAFGDAAHEETSEPSLMIRKAKE